MTKKSERQAAERQSTRAEREAGFDAAITQLDADIVEAEQIENPAERILKLDEIRRNIKETDQEIFNACASEKEGIRVSTYDAGRKAGLIFVPTLIGPPIADAVRSKSVKKKLEAEVKDHLQKMADQQREMRGQLWRVDELVKTAAENNVIEISKSPSCEQVLQVLAVSGVTAMFANAAAKQIAVYEALLAKAAPPQEETAGRKHAQASGIRLIKPNA